MKSITGNGEMGSKVAHIWKDKKEFFCESVFMKVSILRPV